MQLRTEVNQTQFIYRQRLPRGYFKKRKHESKDARPPDIAQMTRAFSPSVNHLDCVNTRRVSKCLLVLILLMGAIVRQGNASAIETDLKVLSLGTTLPPSLHQLNRALAPSMHRNTESGSKSIEFIFTLICQDSIERRN